MKDDKPRSSPKQQSRREFDAAIHLIAIEGIWKIREIEVLDERRVL